MSPRQRPNPDEKEEVKPRPIQNYGPYPTDRNTSVEVAIWSNQLELDSGTITAYNVTVKRSYRTDNGEWKQNQNFRPHDLPVLLHALNQAYGFIMEKKNPANSQE